MTKKEFQADGHCRVTLHAILNQDTLNLAIQIAREEMECFTGETDVNPVLAAARYQQRAGLNKFLNLLYELTDAPVDRKIPKLKELAKTVDDIPKT